MKTQTSFHLTGLIVFSVLLFLPPQISNGQSAYALFDSWPIKKLNGGKLICNDYQVTFFDDFNGNQLDGTKWEPYLDDPETGIFHCGAPSTIFTQNNVNVNNGNLELTIQSTPDYTVTFDTPTDVHCYKGITILKRDITSGCVQMQPGFNLAKFEIKCQFPSQHCPWSAFWMWHHDEIDIFDGGFHSMFHQTSFNYDAQQGTGYWASIERSPCCPAFRECDFCNTQNVDCSADDYCDCNDEIHNPYLCAYMADGFHIVGCEWTPFKVRFYVDGVTTGTVYRYYTLDKNPVDIECGDDLPEMLVRENIAFPDIIDRWWRPIIWITAASIYSENYPCTNLDCPDNHCDPADYPAKLLVDYVKIESRMYEKISIEANNCYELCQNSSSVTCMNVKTEVLNWQGLLSPATATTWSFPSNNVTVSQQNSNCFTYDGPGDVNIQAVIQNPYGASFNLTKSLKPPKPEVIINPIGEYGTLTCISPGDYCGDYSYIFDGQIYNVNSGDGIICHDLNTACDCQYITLNWIECGLQKSLSEPLSLEVACTVSSPDIVIHDQEDITWNECRLVKGNIVIQSGGKLTINCDLGMPENAKIIVEQNGRLNVNSARIYSNCSGRYWDGITVLGSKTNTQVLVQGVPKQGIAYLYNNAVIESANIGVRLQDPVKPHLTGGILWAFDATFKNCKNAMVDIRDYQNYNPYFDNAPIGNSTRFIRCNFVIDDGYAGDFTTHFWGAANLKNVTGINFTECNFRNNLPASLMPSGKPYADFRKYAINSIDAGFSVQGKCLQKLNGKRQQWQRSEFKGFARAIYSGNKGSIRPFPVTGAKFSDNVVGIYAGRIDNSYIVDNVFEVGSDMPVLQPQFGDAANRGVELYNSRGYKVEENTFTTYTGSGTINPVGILTNDSGKASNEIYKNYFDGLYCANLSNGVNRGTNVDEGLVYRCNENSDNQFDFAVPEEQGPGQGIAEFQGAPQQSSGNVFSIDTPQPETHFQNREAPITYFWQTGSNKKPTHYTTSTIDLPLLQSGVNSCSSKLDGDEDGLLSETERQQHQSDFQNSTETSVRTYSADMLIQHYLTDTLQYRMDSVRYWLDRKGDLESRFSIVDTWLQESQPDSAQSALNIIPSQFTFTDEQEVEYGHFSTLKTIQVDAQQNSVSEEQMVNNHLDMLTALAEAGDFHAAVQAQILLNEHAGGTYLPGVILPSASLQAVVIPPTPSPGDIRFQGAGVYVKAIPNPARNTTAFYYWMPEDTTNGKLTLTTLDGRVIREVLLTENSGKLNLDLNRLADGIYLYNLVSDGKTWGTHKLVITK